MILAWLKAFLLTQLCEIPVATPFFAGQEARRCSISQRSASQKRCVCDGSARSL